MSNLFYKILDIEHQNLSIEIYKNTLEAIKNDQTTSESIKDEVKKILKKEIEHHMIRKGKIKRELI